MSVRARVRSIALIALVSVLAACVPPPDPPLVGSVPSPTPGSVPAFSHIVVVTLENQGEDAVFGANGRATAPYLNSLADDGALATNYDAIAHASLGNYLAMTSGQAPTWLAKLDCPFYNCSYPASVLNVADQIETAGKSWKAYMDGMTTPCQHGYPGSLDPFIFRIGTLATYATRHNPFLYYDDITANAARCRAHDVPYSELGRDLRAGQLPSFSYIVPDLCHDGHDDECGLRGADRWAAAELPKILDDPSFQDGGVLFVTFDEAEGSDNSGCCGTDPGGGRIGTIVVSPSYGRHGGYRSTRPYNHYSLLRTIEDAWHLDLLGHAHDAGVSPMTDLFTDAVPPADLPESGLPIGLPLAGGVIVAGVAVRRRWVRLRPTDGS